MRDKAATDVGEPEPPKSIGLIERQVASASRDVDLADLISPKRPESGKNGEVDPVLQAAFEVGQRRVNTAQARLDSLSTVYDRMVGGFMEKEGVAPERPAPPDIRPGHHGAAVLSPAESPDFFMRLQGALPPKVADVLRAGEQAPMTGDVTTAMRMDVTRPLPPDSVPAPAAPSPPDAGTDLTLAQRQDMAMKEWEKLVDAGTDPDEATRILREKYGLPGGQ